MKIIRNRILPFGKKYYAINLFGILFAKGPCGAITINHERIHTAQMKELLFIPFYIFYILEWLIRLLQYRNSFTAYRNISFEREAYANESNPDYLSKRKPYSFLRYIHI
ncbi:MAG: hypothetical protein HDS97_03045 [Bacteroidales bacterium]|nr:hypothetical protein [Bacteroidales bacterium]MDE6258846.1 hypothetical protein [Muribaculaceae bacterium]